MSLIIRLLDADRSQRRTPCNHRDPSPRKTDRHLIGRRDTDTAACYELRIVGRIYP